MRPIYEQINLIAHRGLSGEFCENTLPAFLHACKSNFYGIETDIQFTKDNKMICFHDKTIKRLMGEKLAISEVNYKDLIKKPIKNCDNDHTICTFKHYLKTCKKYKKHCIIEIKQRVNTSQLDMLLKQIKRLRYLKNCIIISFNSSVLTYLRGKEPKLELQLLVGNPIKRYIDYCKKYNIDVSLYDRIILGDTIAKLKAHGIKVGVWTINNRDIALKYIHMGVNYITSDILLT